MSIYKCILELINMSEWLQHISGVLEQTQDKSDLWQGFQRPKSKGLD